MVVHVVQGSWSRLLRRNCVIELLLGTATVFPRQSGRTSGAGRVYAVLESSAGPAKVCDIHFRTYIKPPR